MPLRRLILCSLTLPAVGKANVFIRRNFIAVGGVYLPPLAVATHRLLMLFGKRDSGDAFLHTLSRVLPLLMSQRVTRADSVH